MTTKSSSLLPAILAVTLVLNAACASAQKSRGIASEDSKIQAPDSKKFTCPETDPDFTKFPNGKTFADFKATLTGGTGEAWTDVQQAQYEKLKLMPVDKVQWALIDLDNNKMLSQSEPSKTRIFGASTSKVFVVAALLDKQKGEVKSYPPIVNEIKDKTGNVVKTETISDDDIDHLARIYMHSDNDSWVLLQQRLGKNENGELNADRGRASLIEFTERMGYHDIRGWQGDLLVEDEGKAASNLKGEVKSRNRLGVTESYIHGNELTAADTAKYLYDTYTGRYAGAEYAWKMLYTCQTGEKKGNKYIPKNIFVGGKTGTFPNGRGEMSEVNGVKKKVAVRNHALTFHFNGTQYGLVVLTDLGNNEPAAVLTGGLIREFVGVK
ncbi:MAG: serine hydrolase [Bdellovibrionota bacterium]